MAWKKSSSRNKFNAVKTIVDGIKFDSKKEANYYIVLKERLRKGEISCLKRQVNFDLHGVAGKKVCTMRIDFTYREGGKLIADEVKSTRTAKLPAYRIKQKLFLQEYPKVIFRETI